MEDFQDENKSLKVKEGQLRVDNKVLRVSRVSKNLVRADPDSVWFSECLISTES